MERVLERSGILSDFMATFDTLLEVLGSLSKKNTFEGLVGLETRMQTERKKLIFVGIWSNENLGFASWKHDDIYECSLIRNY